eukprot:TRINITY_DN8839_c0_g1_i1.p1 TRINITY_DN8839_c0_g1~~TRINITY_DN8839_c0_g1_i1.p1  ORF type:complete len:186 (+),score=53.84 TRINITY_DN8839_c0_g1_i1:123-680(+)
MSGILLWGWRPTTGTLTTSPTTAGTRTSASASASTSTHGGTTAAATTAVGPPLGVLVLDLVDDEVVEGQHGAGEGADVHGHLHVRRLPPPAPSPPPPPRLPPQRLQRNPLMTTRVRVCAMWWSLCNVTGGAVTVTSSKSETTVPTTCRIQRRCGGEGKKVIHGASPPIVPPPPCLPTWTQKLRHL